MEVKQVYVITTDKTKPFQYLAETPIDRFKSLERWSNVYRAFDGRLCLGSELSFETIQKAIDNFNKRNLSSECFAIWQYNPCCNTLTKKVYADGEILL